MKTYKTSLFLFRRDLRLEDNTGLIYALESSETVIPAFVFTEEQIEKNPYRSNSCVQFMIESLQELFEQLQTKGSQLYFFSGSTEKTVSLCIQKLQIDALIVNKDYTPYSTQRDEKLSSLCKKHGVAFHALDDALLHSPEDTLKKDGTPYTIFTPYLRNAMNLKVAPARTNRRNNYYQKPIPFAESPHVLSKISSSYGETHFLQGGRKHALKILKSLGSMQAYDQTRDFPAENATTHLSPYLKFTVCSPREVYAAITKQLGPHHSLIRSLYWRDFFTSLTYFFPHVMSGAFHKKYNKIRWSYNKSHFQRWCERRTGFPIVDAGMRELIHTGFMHNRVRMITASFLVKDLHIDWRWGEKFFSQHLIDYDPAVNNGNWQWVASTGADAQPYFRIMNPWIQQKKFDPDCLYIQRWVEELRSVPCQAIHKWHETKHQLSFPQYEKPMVCHEEKAKKALLLMQDRPF